jgi:hypothetical protein
MTDRRGGGDRGVEAQAPGYRGALPPRTDRLARPWVVVVFVIFVLIFALSFANIPSSIFPTPSVTPLPSFSIAPSGSGGPSGSPNASASAAATASGSASAAPSASVSPIPSVTP